MTSDEEPQADPESDECRDVYAHFGLAMSSAQVTEEALVGLITIGQYPLNRDQAEELMTRLDASTLGQLIKELRRRLSFEPSVESVFTIALEQRNYLAHDFFRKHAVDFITHTGRLGMLNELGHAQACFQELNAHVSRIFLRLGQPYGIGQSTIDRLIKEMLSSASSTRPHPDPS